MRRNNAFKAINWLKRCVIFNTNSVFDGTHLAAMNMQHTVR
jgi:hypothetical protein